MHVHRVVLIYLGFRHSAESFITQWYHVTKIYLQALSKQASPEPDMSLSSKSCIYHSQNIVACMLNTHNRLWASCAIALTRYMHWSHM